MSEFLPKFDHDSIIVSSTGMEHDFILVSSRNTVSQKDELIIKFTGVQYHSQFIEVSYVYIPPYPLKYIRATFTVE